MSNLHGRGLTGLFTILILGAHVACSGGKSLADDAPVSRGPKIFVTATGHLADFIDDTELPGTTVIDKADALCNRDANKPDNGTYKALFVDGVNRSAKPAIDWALAPSTTYYASHGDLVIGTTTTAAIFDTEHEPLANPIGTTPAGADPDDVDQVWTGIGNNVDFSTGNTCSGWTGDPGAGTPPSANAGSRGFSGSTSGEAFYSLGDYGCDYFQLYLYCVEQP
jgi:Protein of unknown function (DUF1554)